MVLKIYLENNILLNRHIKRNLNDNILFISTIFFNYGD